MTTISRLVDLFYWRVSPRQKMASSSARFCSELALILFGGFTSTVVCPSSPAMLNCSSSNAPSFFRCLLGNSGGSSHYCRVTHSGAHRSSRRSAVELNNFSLKFILQLSRAQCVGVQRFSLKLSGWQISPKSGFCSAANLYFFIKEGNSSYISLPTFAAHTQIVQLT